MTIAFKNFKIAIWKSVLFLLIFTASIAALVIPYMTKVDKQLLPVFSRLIQDIISLLPVIFASWVMTKYVDKIPLNSIGLKNKNLIYDFCTGSGIALFWIAISFGGQYLCGSVIKDIGNKVSALNFCIYALALFINAATQEILCRGYLFQTIKNNVGARSAIIITSILFVCMHGGALKSGIIPSLNVFGAGLVFAIAYYKTGNLWMPIAIHFIWNFTCSLILFIPNSGYEGLHLFKLKGSELLAGGKDGLEATIITTVTILIIIMIEEFLLKQRNVSPN